MTIHIDIARSTATLAEVVDLVANGESVIVDREGRPLGELVLQRSADRPSGSRHRFVGAFAHLGPLTEEEAALFLGAGPEM